MKPPAVVARTRIRFCVYIWLRKRLSLVRESTSEFTALKLWEGTVAALASALEAAGGVVKCSAGGIGRGESNPPLLTPFAGAEGDDDELSVTIGDRVT